MYPGTGRDPVWSCMTLMSDLGADIAASPCNAGLSRNAVHHPSAKSGHQRSSLWQASFLESISWPTFSIRLLLSSISQQTKPDGAPQPLRIENNIDLRVKIVFENAIDQRRAEFPVFFSAQPEARLFPARGAQPIDRRGPPNAILFRHVRRRPIERRISAHWW